MGHRFTQVYTDTFFSHRDTPVKWSFGIKRGKPAVQVSHLVLAFKIVTPTISFPSVRIKTS
ncbi:MAG: hypothetical protein MUO88_05625, partial [Desulfobacterales bacterium]|nr:hypothetical protein [Desulfobacterales bacterium]